MFIASDALHCQVILYGLKMDIIKTIIIMAY